MVSAVKTKFAYQADEYCFCEKLSETFAVLENNDYLCSVKGETK